jgi:hypothetical protein
MRRVLNRFCSPTLLLAVAAVIFAGTGSAIAARLITSKQIKDGSIQLKDLSKKARQALSGGRGPQGPSGFNGTPGAPGAPGLPAPASGSRFSATVLGDGTLVAARSSAGTSAVKTATGAYTVVFDRDISACAYVATPMNPLAAPETIQVAVQGNAVTANKGVFLQTANNAGTLVDSGLFLVVSC